ncbi:MAG: hypothetical protein PQJ59_11830 [Spirochaetales bacterium]|nr:hypothetical protein [Spirochaetales bacterium]
MKKTLLILMTFALLAGGTLFAKGNNETETTVETAPQTPFTIDDAAAELGITGDELKAALGDPKAGPANMADAAAKLGIEEAKLTEVFSKLTPMGEENVEVDQYILNLNGIEVPTTYPTFSWKELPADVDIERLPVETFTNAAGDTHYYEVIYVKSGNLNWYQAAYLAEDAGGYLACPETEEENAFVFELVNDDKYFWHFEEGGDHYGISIGPFLGGYQPEGSAEPAGGWLWLSGNEWDWTNWAVNLDDGVTDKDPRDNTQPNNSGESQPIMGYGEMNLPVPTWGDYMEAVGAYGLTRSPGQNYAFIIEYETTPN